MVANIDVPSSLMGFLANTIAPWLSPNIDIGLVIHSPSLKSIDLT